MGRLNTVRARIALTTVVAFLILAGVADARITIRLHASPSDSFFFHGNYSDEPFDPSDGFGLEIWNCGSGVSPTFVAQRDALIVCRDASGTGFTPGYLVYSVALPAGACVDNGRSCYYRDPAVPFRRDGVRSLRVEYARRGHGNRVWLESFGDLSGADQANMMVVIKVNGQPRAILEDSFTPLENGGWYSSF
jgi:hypothetical protein